MKLHLRALCRLCILGSAVCTIGLCQTAHAQLPTFVAGRPGVSQAHVGDMAMTYGEQTALERRLAKAVVVVRAQGDSVHPLAQGTRVFDGAAVAISASALTDVIDPEFVASDDTAKPESNHAHSFFDDSYRRSSSPFADKTPPKRESDAMRQYFLTTADWLTGAKKITVALDKTRIPRRRPKRRHPFDATIAKYRTRFDIRFRRQRRHLARRRLPIAPTAIDLSTTDTTRLFAPTVPHLRHVKPRRPQRLPHVYASRRTRRAQRRPSAYPYTSLYRSLRPHRSRSAPAKVQPHDDRKN